MIVVCLSSTCAHINFDISCKINRTPSTCDLSSCHQHVPGIFHGRMDPVTNNEVLELMASQNSQHLSSSVQVRRVSCNVSFLISTKNLSSSDAAVDAMGVWKLSKSKRKNCRSQRSGAQPTETKHGKTLSRPLLNPKNSHTYLFSTDSRENRVHLINCHMVTAKETNCRTLGSILQLCRY